MRDFRWCRQEEAENCRFVGDHAHICITTPGGRDINPNCGKESLRQFFHDLDPAAIRRTPAYENNPELGDDIIAGCFTEEQARRMVGFVYGAGEEKVIIVNCEAGISRSPGVVLALRRKFGGDTEEVFREAHPNIHVTSVLSKVLALEDYEGRKSEGGIGI